MRLVTSTVRFSKTKDGETSTRGYEQQRYSFLPDGTVTVNAFAVALDHRVSKDVTINLNRSFRPIDSYVRIHGTEKLVGVGWFRFDQEGVTAQLSNHQRGDYQERIDVAGGVTVFNGHTIATDALITTVFDRGSDERVQFFPRGLYLSSAHYFGATGPNATPTKVELEYVGPESLQTPVGVLETEQWYILPGRKTTGHSHPGERIWTLKDSFIFVRAAIPDAGLTYELESFHEFHV